MQVWIILNYMGIVNIISYCIMGIDKKRARNGEYRISEKTIWTWAFVGGGMGAFLGMRHFRHKTKHFVFKWGLPILMTIQLVLLITYFIR